MEIKIYRVMREYQYEGTDMDGCPITETDLAVHGEYLSKVEAIRQAQRVFSRTSAVWVPVYLDTITEKGRTYGKRIYNLYRHEN